MSVDPILEQVEALPADQRSELLDRLHNRYGDGGPDQAGLPTPAQLAEIQRRVAWSDANPGSGIPWEEVLAKSLKRCRP